MLASGRDSRIPVITPAITLPITLPRLSGGTIAAAAGTRICMADRAAP